MTAVESQL